MSILTNAGYSTCSIARSVDAALSIGEKKKPDLVLVDIFLQGEGTGIDLGKILNEKKYGFRLFICQFEPADTGRSKANKAIRVYGKTFQGKGCIDHAGCCPLPAQNPPGRKCRSPIITKYRKGCSSA